MDPSLVTSGGAHLRDLAPGQHSVLSRNVAAVVSHWRHCDRFDRSRNRTPDPTHR